MDEQLDELAISHQEFGDQINVPVTGPTIGSNVILGKIELVKEIFQRCDGCRLGTIILVPVDVENLLPRN